MPIPIDQLRVPSPVGQPLHDRILEFLAGAPTQAFTLLEILAGIEGHPSAEAALGAILKLEPMEQEASIARYQDALGFLLLEDAIIGVEHDGEGYYYRRPR